MKFLASITMLYRMNHVLIGYRPHLVSVESQTDFCVKDIFNESKTIKKDETSDVLIETIRDVKIKENEGFSIFEGRKIVGVGKVLKIQE